MKRTDRRALAGAAAALLLGWSAQAAEPVTVEQQIGGLTVLADWVEAEHAAPDAPVVLLLHGTLADKDQELVDTLQELLAERGISSLAPSLSLGIDRRTGPYDCSVPFRHTHEQAVDEMAAWAGWLRAERQTRIVAAGHSRGGNQAALFASLHPEIVERVVTIAPAVGHDEAERDRRYRARYRADRKEVLAMADGGGDLIDVPGIVYCRDTAATPEAIRSYLGGPFAERDTPTLVSGLPMPVLVIAGSRDTTVPELPERMAAIPEGGRIRFEVIEDADHFFLDFYAEDAADLISEFIAE